MTTFGIVATIALLVFVGVVLWPKRDPELRGIEEWDTAQETVRAWHDCDGSYTCTADEHTPGCYADGYSSGDVA